MELVPLIVKVAAINRLMSSARKLRRVVLNRSTLFIGVAVLNSVMVVCLISWTILDPPKRQAKDQLSEKMTEAGETIVIINYHCDSEHDGWMYTALSWNTLLLVIATVLAFQSRNVRQEFNESQTLTTMIYSHFMFLVLRLVSFLLKDRKELNESDLTSIRSIIHSTDAIATICIYFIPKFFAKSERSRNSGSKFSVVSTASSNGGYYPKRLSGEDDHLQLFSGSSSKHKINGDHSVASLTWDQSLAQMVESMKQRNYNRIGGDSASIGSHGSYVDISPSPPERRESRDNDSGSCSSDSDDFHVSFALDITPSRLIRQHSDGLMEQQSSSVVSFADSSLTASERNPNKPRVRQHSSGTSLNGSFGRDETLSSKRQVISLQHNNASVNDNSKALSRISSYLEPPHEEYITKLSA